MILAIILVCCLPVLFVLFVIVAIGAAASKTYRKGKRAYADFKPYINDMSEKMAKAQNMTGDFADRGAKLTESFEEIGGRWAFIVESVNETIHSPAARLAGMAGKFASRRGD